MLFDHGGDVAAEPASSDHGNSQVLRRIQAKLLISKLNITHF